MSTATQTIQQTKTNVTISASSNVRITNKILLIKETEYEHVLINNLKSIIIKCRGLSDLKLCFVLGESATKYITIHKGCSLTLTNLEFISKALYIQASNDSETIEILELY